MTQSPEKRLLAITLEKFVIVAIVVVALSPLSWAEKPSGQKDNKGGEVTRAKQQQEVAERSHWAFRSPLMAVFPMVKGAWGVNEIDSFVLAELEEKGLQPSPEADRRTLIRRVSLDTTGLLPTLDEVEHFLNDRSEYAYKRMLDRLLNSPRYGEHRARYWLDAARYGDSHGLQRDNYRSIWPYRDWVIQAYNDNMPFDQFTVEQLAGDLLPSPTQAQIVATGFNRCSVSSGEDGSIGEELLNRYGVDRVSTLGSVWLGLTLNCAQCHDHKIDPVSQKEFYQLLAFFNNTTQKGHDANSMRSFPSIRVYRSPAIKKQVEVLSKQILEKKNELKKIEREGRMALIRWVNDPIKVLKTGKSLRLRGALLKQVAATEKKDEALNLGNLGELSRYKPFSFSFRVTLPDKPGKAVIFSCTDSENHQRGYRLLWQEQGLRLELIERWPERILRRSTARRFKEGQVKDVVVTYDGSGSSEGISFYLDGELVPSRNLRNWVGTMKGDFATSADLRIGGRSGKEARMVELGRFQVYDHKLGGEEAEVLTMLNKLKLDRRVKRGRVGSEEFKTLGKLHYLADNEKYRQLFDQITVLETQERQLKSLAPNTLVMEEREEPAFAFVLERGDYEKKLAKVEPDVPSMLQPSLSNSSRNRLGLAQWLVDPENTLTARVTVNRFWSEIFGIGLVGTAGDFGLQGEAPSHPELLDWMALNFIKSGWDVKATYRKMLMSATYRQSSRADFILRKKDPHNRLLARGARFRMDAEVIRDQALASSGLLVNRIGGPGVHPHQPAGLWQTVGYTRSNTQTFSQDYGEAGYRRSLYTFIKRSSPAPNMSVFNAPSREFCVLTRERTNTPLQALALLNDPQYINAARHLALRAINSQQTFNERLHYLSRVLFARSFNGQDLEVMRQSYYSFEKKYRDDHPAAKALIDTLSLPKDDKVGVGEMAAWIVLANKMLNLDETITKY